MRGSLTEISLKIGPLNTASQATAWATAVQNDLKIGASTFGYDGLIARRFAGTVNDRTDFPIAHPRLAPRFVRAIELRRTLRGSTHILNESNMSMLGDRKMSHFTDEFRYFEQQGMRTAIVFHGSDVRDPDLVMARNPNAFFHDAPDSFVSKLRLSSRVNREKALDSGVPLFVSTPDLLEHVPGSVLLPLTVDQKKWKKMVSSSSDERPKVLHRPAGNGVVTKGSKYIIPVLEEFEEAGLIHVVRPEVVSHTNMRKVFSSVDIVVDQLGLDTYGVTAVEAMASGCVVIAAIGGSTISCYGDDIPIVNASPDSFGDVLYELINNPDRMRSTAVAGPAFVSKWHSGRAASEALRNFLDLE